MALSAEELETVRAALTGDGGPELMKLMKRLTTQGRPAGDFSTATLQLARGLGWTDRFDFPTDLGWLMGDPIREYVKWEERGRTVHEWEELRVMHEPYFLDRDLLAIGCGCGTNLFSFSTMCRSVIGLEIESTYLQFTGLWAELAGVPVPATVCGGGEEMPFDSESFDIVVCLGALQYMKIQAVHREVARVLRPGGMFIFTLSDLPGYVRELATRARSFRRPREVLREGAIFVNMIAYPWLGRTVARHFDPVYPTRARMQEWVEAAGLALDETLTEPYGHEICYVARRPG